MCLLICSVCLFIYSAIVSISSLLWSQLIPWIRMRWQSACETEFVCRFTEVNRIVLVIAFSKYYDCSCHSIYGPCVYLTYVFGQAVKMWIIQLKCVHYLEVWRKFFDVKETKQRHAMRYGSTNNRHATIYWNSWTEFICYGRIGTWPPSFHLFLLNGRKNAKQL